MTTPQHTQHKFHALLKQPTTHTNCQTQATQKSRSHMQNAPHGYNTCKPHTIPNKKNPEFMKHAFRTLHTPHKTHAKAYVTQGLTDGTMQSTQHTFKAYDTAHN